MRFRLRTLLIVLALGPPLLGFGYQAYPSLQVWWLTIHADAQLAQLKESGGPDEPVVRQAQLHAIQLRLDQLLESRWKKPTGGTPRPSRSANLRHRNLHVPIHDPRRAVVDRGGGAGGRVDDSLPAHGLGSESSGCEN